MARRTKQTLKRRAPAHRREVLKLRSRKTHAKAEHKRHHDRARRKSGGKKK
jgi:hypothetical protein